jgi:RNA polymerase sigma factor (sigma-70 family)
LGKKSGKAKMKRSALAITDESIISGMQEGGPAADDAIRHLYRNYYSLLSQFVISNNGSPQDAEDIFQEVIVAFMNIVRAGKFRGESGLQTFLYALNRNIWLNELKRRTRKERREMKYELSGADSSHDIHYALEYRQSTTQLMEVMSQLGDVCKKILLLFYYENQSMKDILHELEYENEQVVRNKKSKCLKKMEELVHSNQALQQQLKTLLHG